MSDIKHNHKTRMWESILTGLITMAQLLWNLLRLLKKLIQTGLSIIASLIALTAMLWWIGIGPFGSPSDWQMVLEYRLQRAQFEKLANMLEEETTLFSIAPHHQRCLDLERVKIPAGEDPRCDAYLEIFDTLGFEATIIHKFPVYLEIYQSGFPDYGVQRGYLYAPEGTDLPGVVVSRTRGSDMPYPRLKELTNGWYIYLDH